YIYLKTFCKLAPQINNILFCTVCVVTAIRRTDLFPFGDLNGDLILPEGDDETSRALTLPRPFYFFDSPFSQLYVSGHEWHRLGSGPANGKAVC
uniref:Uncharacterized protein n=2 Tax=Xiphophorus TaxID=8082 RepID=A0A3B5QP71_XIPMA